MYVSDLIWRALCVSDVCVCDLCVSDCVSDVCVCEWRAGEEEEEAEAGG